MSSNFAIKVEDLSKCYHIYDKPRDRLLQMLLRGKKKYYREFWATKNISFDIKKGETVGIVGKNGSGKSTLLQMICGTLNPTAGSITTNGRIAALLELGSGFNPEFTGRENVYMNAAILGLSKEETDSRYDEILKFAEIGDFIDQPVKTYSSGMLVRLAFSVAINVDPQILVVDEALSVGDELFQRKCYSRIEAIKKSGATILFVSHSGAAITELCDSALLIDTGELLRSGKPKEIVGLYQKLLYAPMDKRESIRDSIVSNVPLENLAARPSTDVLAEIDEFFDPHLKPTSTIEYEQNGARIENTRIFSPEGRRVNNLKSSGTYHYKYRVTFDKTVTNVRFGMLIKTTSGVELGGSHTASSAQYSIPVVESSSVYEIEFTFNCHLNPGTYFMNAGVIGCLDGAEVYLHRLLDVQMFRVIPAPENLSTAIVDFGCRPKIECLV
jgi:lipopolysaccharide transport system ATP-binding protein